eukprot:COSAG02_NODE_38992_length_422_cov_0.919505_1_plen_89_part_01
MRWSGYAAPATLLIGLLCCDSAMALDNGLDGTPPAAASSLKTDEQFAGSVNSDVIAHPSRTSCSDDASCSFNGICKQQQCHCVSGWRGS